MRNTLEDSNMALIVSALVWLALAAVIAVPVVYIVGAVAASIAMARHYAAIDNDE